MLHTANVQFAFFLHELLRGENAESSQFHSLRPKAIGLYGEAVKFHSPGSRSTPRVIDPIPNLTLKALYKDGRVVSRRVF